MVTSTDEWNKQMKATTIDTIFDALPVIGSFAVSLFILIGMTRLY